ncbi:unnamed protein product [Camellia sinensis]
MRFSLHLPPPSKLFQISISDQTLLFLKFPTSSPLSIRAFVSSSETKKDEKEKEFKFSTGSAKSEGENGSARSSDEEYPSGEFKFKEFGAWKKFAVKLRMLVAFPWERIPNGTVLTMKLRGQISDQLESRVYAGLSLPQICENFTKAAYDPCISELWRPPSAYFSLYGLTVQASFLGGTNWPSTLISAICSMHQVLHSVLEKVGIDPQAQKVGKYKSVGDQLTCKNMSEETCEMLTSLLDNIYGNWLDNISLTKGVYQVERLKEDGWITNIKYDDE